MSPAVQDAAQTLRERAQSFSEAARRSSLWPVYEHAKDRGLQLKRAKWRQILWEFGIYAILLLIIYFALVGLPLWKGSVYWLYWVVDHKFVVQGTFSITIGIAAM